MKKKKSTSRKAAPRLVREESAAIRIHRVTSPRHLKISIILRNTLCIPKSKPKK